MFKVLGSIPTNTKKKKKKEWQLSVVVHTYNPNTAASRLRRRIMSSGPARDT
jgi:hypothetical protein